MFATKLNVQWSQISRTVGIQQENKPIFFQFFLLQQLSENLLQFVNVKQI